MADPIRPLDALPIEPPRPLGLHNRVDLYEGIDEARWQQVTEAFLIGLSQGKKQVRVTADSLAALQTRLETLAEKMEACHSTPLHWMDGGPVRAEVTAWAKEIRALLADGRTTP